MSRKPVLRLAFAFVAASALARSAQAGLSDGAPLAALPGQLLPLETVQFIYNGRQYCWYEDGWRGPGWYWCGQASHEGVGWGGAYGWNGWRTVHDGGYRRRPRHPHGEGNQGGAN